MAPDDFFQLHRYKDFRYRQRCTISRYNAPAVTNQTGIGRQFFLKMPWAHFSIQKDTGRRPAGYQVAIGRRRDGADTNTFVFPRSAAVQTPSDCSTICAIICVQLLVRSRISIESLRILNNVPKGNKEKKTQRKLHEKDSINFVAV